MPSTDELTEQLEAIRKERDQLKTDLMQSRLDAVRQQIATHHLQLEDHEDRLRSAETIGTKFNLLMTMFFGNGLLSAIALFKLFSQ